MGRAVLVVGATGYIGSHLIPRLDQADVKVTALGRDASLLQAFNWPDRVKTCVADLLHAEHLVELCQGIDTAYYLVHSMSAGYGYAERDRQAALNFAAAAAEAGVRHIIYLGALSPEQTRSVHLRSRSETGTALRSCGVMVTEVRAPIIIGPGSVPFELMRDVVNHFPFMPMPAQMTAKSSPIALDDLLDYLQQLPLLPQLHGQLLEVSGPQALSYAEQMRCYGAVVGRSFHPLLVPGLPVSLAGWLSPLFSPAPRGIVRALIGGLAHDICADTRVVQQAMPKTLLNFEQAVLRALEMEQHQQPHWRWHQGNMRFRKGDMRNGYYGMRLRVERALPASCEQVWRQLIRLGGEQGYFFLNLLWRTRAWLDALVGGPGTFRGRSDNEPVSGGFIDTWTVVDVVPQRRLLLQMNMKAPGAGTLEFVLQPSAQGMRLRVCAYWHPRSIWGQAYWYLMWPAHLLLFKGMLWRIGKLSLAQ